MGRAPCCEKMGMKKGPWTPEEDDILINYIRLYGHSNWRALPKQAGLLRCGKSCRLRWINYLRPDIKRGNFTPHEEQTIINLHHLLGNRWSAIAAKLPGRTDNEIKNVWHTHLKKRIKLQNNNNNNVGNTKDKNSSAFNTLQELGKKEDEDVGEAIDVAERPTSPQQSDISASTTLENADDSVDHKMSFALSEDFSALIDESFWSDMAFRDNYVLEDDRKELEVWEPHLEEVGDDGMNGTKSNYYSSKLYNDDLEFWFGLVTGAGELFDIPEF